MDVAQRAVWRVVGLLGDGLDALVGAQPFCLQRVQHALLPVFLDEGAHLAGEGASLGQAQAVAACRQGFREDGQFRLTGCRQLGQGKVGNQRVQGAVLQRQQLGGQVVVVADVHLAHGLFQDFFVYRAGGRADGRALEVRQVLEAGGGIHFGHHRHDAPHVIRLGEVHPLGPLLGDGEPGRSRVVLARFDARHEGGNLHVVDVEPVAVGLAEPHHDVHVVAHDPALLYVSKGGAAAFGRKLQCAVGGGQFSPIRHGL